MNTEPVRNDDWHPHPNFNINDINALSDDDRLQYMTYAQAHPHFTGMMKKRIGLYKFPGKAEWLPKNQAIGKVQDLIRYNEQSKEATQIRLAAFTENVEEKESIQQAKRVIKIYEEHYDNLLTETMEFIEQLDDTVYSEEIEDFMDGEANWEGYFEDWLNDSGSF